MSARLFLHVVSLESRRLMSYRADFWIQTIAGFLTQIGIVFFLWQAVYHESGSERIGGYAFEDMLLYYVLVILLGKLVRGVDMAGDVSGDIYQGALSRYLVYPTGYLRFKYAQHLGNLAPALVQCALFAPVLLLVGGPLESRIGPVQIGMCVVAVAAGNVLRYLLLFPIQMVAFWADNVWSLVVMTRFVSGLFGGFLLPLSLYPEWAQAILALLPFQYFYYFPVRVLTGDASPAAFLSGIAVALAWSAALALAGRVVWRRGNLVYTGVGI